MTMRKNTKDFYQFGIVEGQSVKSVDLSADAVKKDFLTIFYKQRKQKNNLLGEFSSDGKYAISDERILKELINLPKKFDRKEDSTIYACEKVDEVVLNFKIEFDISPSYCTAKLYFIEIENLLEENVKHVTQLSEYLDIYDPKFKDTIYRMWKVYFDEEVYDKNDYLYNLLHKQQESLNFNKELVDVLSQLYLMRMLKLLETSGEAGQKTVQEYKTLVEKLASKNPGLRLDNAELKRLLDGIIIKNGMITELLKTQEGKAILVGYTAPIKRLEEKETSVVVEASKKQSVDKQVEKKTEKSKPKAKAKAKAANKSKGGASKPIDFSKIFGKTNYGSFSIPKTPEIKEPTTNADIKKPETKEKNDTSSNSFGQKYGRTAGFEDNEKSDLEK